MKNENFEIEFITIEPKSEVLNEDKPIIHYKNSRRHKSVWDRNKYEEKKVVWFLRKYIGNRVDDGIDWVYQAPSEQLNKDLTADKIVKKLNSENLYDFEYFPKENDSLYIRIEYVNEKIKSRIRPNIDDYISFIFKQGYWTINIGYEQTLYNYEDFKEGIIKYHI